MNTAKLHKNGIYKTTKSNYSAMLHPASYMFKEQSRWVFYNEIVLTTREFMRNVSEIEDRWLLEVAPHYINPCLLYTSPSPRDGLLSRMPSSA